MQDPLRRIRWWKLTAVVLACGSLFQSGACSQGLGDLAESWTTTVSTQYLALYFADQFNAVGSPF